MASNQLDDAYSSHGRNFAENLEVLSFRGLSDVRLDGLKQVNLLVGGNNSGKTSILEAIAVLYAGNDLRKWLDISFVREVRTFASSPAQMSVLDTISWMFPSHDVELFEHSGAGEISMSAQTPVGRRGLRATIDTFEGFLDESDMIGAQRRLLRVGNERRHSDEPVSDNGIELNIETSTPSEGLFPDEEKDTFQIWSQIGLRTMKKARSRENVVQYIPPYGHRNSSSNITALSRSIQEDNTTELNDLMSSLDSRISGVELVTSGNQHRPQIAIRLEDRKLVPVSVMGDGVRRALSIALSILASNRGILLIDEVEAAFHVSAFSKIFDWMVLAAKKHQVQIFATTHSLEAIEGIANSTESTHDLSAYLIGPEDGKVVKNYTGGMLQRLVVEAGLDIRF
ncbi:AAA family ATPase [Phaeobacter inhibens]|uniref:AAA family ATPase n=1 Tax=Phaeobacter inhibens TaxID=221822 RepID=UPI0021A90A47|nr:ATP-binding protein [Phaeobacter inhibens]UWR86976.1 ATP-binding protein [Phaeobacter inhibens]